MSIRTNDGTQTKRLSGKPGDRYPTYGFNRPRAFYTATGGETTITLSSLNPALSYNPGRAQISVKRSTGGSLISGTDFYETSSTVITFPSGDALATGEIVEITLEALATGIMAMAPSPQCYTADATLGQTVVTADFSWPYNLNPTKAIGGCIVFLNGAIQTRGADFTEVNLGTGSTNRIAFVDALSGGENIIILPAYQAIDTSAAQSSFNGQALLGLQNMMTAGTQGFVDQSAQITVPNTAIVGRAKIPDLANDLRASFGIERIPTQAMMQLQNEVGPNGEQVFSAVNDDRGLIRFYGSWWYYQDVNGQYCFVGSNAGYCEVVFYGTGLNILGLIDSAKTYTVSVDGGSESSVVVTSATTTLDGRYVNPNQPLTLSSGLTLGIHTVKFRTTTGNNIVAGFEVLNANASGLININPGYGYLGGVKYTNSAVDSVSYKASSYTFTVTSANATVGATYTNNSQTFTVLATIASGTQLVCSGTGAPAASGTLTQASGVGDATITFSAYVTGMYRGGRIVHYLNTDGTVGQAYQAVNSTASTTLSNVDHSNEEVARVYNWREFGAGRYTAGDDFSLIPTGASNSSRAFTLDDGTTTLAGIVGVETNQNNDLLFASSTNYFTLTFVGTGLDIVAASSGARNSNISIDGGSALNLVYSGATTLYTQKIVSGLPYGTHTVKVTGNTGATLSAKQFIVYQPKKPTLPSTALELCDYNLAANFAQVSSTANAEYISGGVLRKHCTREFIYTGTWVAPAIQPSRVGGFDVLSVTNSATTYYTFFGTGIDVRYRLDSAVVGTFELDGSTNFTSRTYASVGGGTFTPATGQMTATSTVQASFAVTGLTLGLHTIKLSYTSATGNSLGVYAFDVITPIYATKSNLYADLQNTLPVGSNSLMDSRKTSLVKETLPAQKAWAQAVGQANANTSSTSFVPIPDLSVTIKTSGGAIEAKTSVDLYLDASGWRGAIAIFVDGVKASGVVTGQAGTSAGAHHTMPFISTIVPVAPGVHKVDVYWKVESGTTIYTYVDSTTRMLSVQEL